MYRVESRRNQAQASICPLPLEMQGECLIFPRWYVKCCQRGKLIWALESRVFTGIQSHRHAALIPQHPPSRQPDMACPRYIKIGIDRKSHCQHKLSSVIKFSGVLRLFQGLRNYIYSNMGRHIFLKQSITISKCQSISHFLLFIFFLKPQDEKSLTKIIFP